MKKLFLLTTILFISSPLFAVQVCPDGGVLGLNGSCCKNGWFYNEYKKGYTQLYTSDCGCPDDGTPLNQYTDEEGHIVQNNFLCCKNNYEYNTETREYDRVSPEFCGCPDGGMSITSDYYKRKICCKDGYEYNDKTRSYDRISIEGCGCPKGSNLQTGKWKVKYCCKDGIAFRGHNEPSLEPTVCGCPENGKIWEGNWMDGTTLYVKDTCQKDGYLWNKFSQKYEIPNAILGCPPETEEINGFCCKNGYTFNSRTSKWDGINGNCGCPAGSARSKWGEAFKKYVMSTQKTKLNKKDIDKMLKMRTQFDMACCKDGKLHNEKTDQFDIEIPICGEPPKTEEEWQNYFFSGMASFIGKIQ